MEKELFYALNLTILCFHNDEIIIKAIDFCNHNNLIP